MVASLRLNVTMQPIEIRAATVDKDCAASGVGAHKRTLRSPQNLNASEIVERVRRENRRLPKAITVGGHARHHRWGPTVETNPANVDAGRQAGGRDRKRGGSALQ